VDAALGDDHALRSLRPRDQLELRGAIDLERREVARIDADHLGVEGERAVELVRVVRFDQRLEPELACVGHQRGGALVVDVAQQDQGGVRSGDLRLQQLELLGEEALRQQRHRRRAAGGLQVVDRTAEAIVDEDRDRRCAGVRELGGEACGIGVRP
jgi:hypothetical protein